MKRRQILETIRHAQDEFGSLVTNRRCTRREVMRCVDAGLVESIGLVDVYDDSNTLTNRVREGFILTTRGREQCP